MASATCITSNGVYSAAAPYKTASAACVTKAGVASAASRVAWGGNATPRTLLQMLPSPRARWTNADGTPSNEFYKLIAEVIRYLDNMRGLTVAQVVESVQQTQAQVTTVESLATGALTVANASADAVNTVADVAVDNGLSGADAVPRIRRYGRFELVE